MKRDSMTQPVRVAAWAWTVLLVAGCQRAQMLMPTPNVYLGGGADPFADVAPALRSNRVEIVYLTDRQPEGSSPDWQAYGYKRSRSTAYGVAEVQFGKDVSWDELVKASRAEKRVVKLELTVPKVKELGRFPPTPRTLIALPPSSATTRPAVASATADVQEDPEQEAADEAFRKVLSERINVTGGHDVYLFIHGYNNSLVDSVTTIAQLWHFFGRTGVAVAYSWPAGAKGLVRGYTYDRESSEFTVYHLKQALRLIASCPDVGRVHVIAHSRGTDVAVSALRELHLEIGGGGRSTRDELKLGTVVLAAPDMDLDVVIQRATTARLGLVPERFALYVCSKDKALGAASWLFGSIGRLGQLRSDIFTPEELHALRNAETIQIIDARVSKLGSYGHGYFYASPAVSSDLVLLVRYRRPVGEEHGRPLRIHENGFWMIDDKYPAPAPSAQAYAARATRP